MQFRIMDSRSKVSYRLDHRTVLTHIVGYAVRYRGVYGALMIFSVLMLSFLDSLKDEF